MMLESDFTALSTAQRAALHEAMIYVQQRYDPLGIIAGGSIIRGNGGPTSDFDIYVIHDKPYRQRIQKRFSGVPAEIFVNNAASVRSYFPSECKAGRPITAHILATGVPLLKRDEVVDQLIGEAHEWLKKRPDLTSKYSCSGPAVGMTRVVPVSPRARQRRTAVSLIDSIERNSGVFWSSASPW